VFDEKVAEKLIENKGKVCDVETTQDGKFTNITAFLGAYGTAEPEPASAPFEDRFKEGNENKLKSMATSYAKDMYQSEIQSLIPKCKDLKESLEVIESRRGLIGDTALLLYKLIKEKFGVDDGKDAE